MLIDVCLFCCQVYIICSIYALSFCIAAWGWVGYGHSTNLQKTSELKRKETDPHKLIVSRSHAGAVEETAKQAFGNNVVVTPAGGAGMITLFNHRLR